jgi:hypothetical protein
MVQPVREPNEPEQPAWSSPCRSQTNPSNRPGSSRAVAKRAPSRRPWFGPCGSQTNPSSRLGSGRAGAKRTRATRLVRAVPEPNEPEQPAWFGPCRSQNEPEQPAWFGPCGNRTIPSSRPGSARAETERSRAAGLHQLFDHSAMMPSPPRPAGPAGLRRARIPTVAWTSESKG